MAQPSSIYAVARIHALEPKLLDRGKIERMIEADTADDVLKILAEAGDYGTAISDLAGAWDYEKMLVAERQKLLELLDKISPQKEITDVFFMKYDVHNMKVLTKAYYLDREYDEFLSATSTIEPAAVKRALADGDYSELPHYLAEALTEIKTLSEEKVDPQTIEVVLERAMYEEIIAVCKRYRQTGCLEFFTTEIDLLNLKSYFRVVKAGLEPGFFGKVFLPGGLLAEDVFWNAFKEGSDRLPEFVGGTKYTELLQETLGELKEGKSLSNFEKQLENIILAKIKELAKNKYQHIEPVIAYIFAKEYEAKIIRMIMVAKINGLEKASIRERLRDSYV